MKILLLGKNGQTGWELQRTLASLGMVIALGRQDLDLIDHQGIRRTVRTVRPDIIVNAAAHTAVDRAENEQEQAMAINGIAPGILAEEGWLCKASMIHYSTDYIFDGIKRTPYTEDDTPNPINIYGKTKLHGENAIKETEIAHLILRTSWLYGLRGNNFLLTILRLAREQDQLRIVDDQFGSPTWCRLIAEVTAQLLAQKVMKKDTRQTYHLSSAGVTTWYRFARAIVDNFKFAEDISFCLEPIRSNQYNALAQRPVYSVLSSDKLKRETGLVLPDWRNVLHLALETTK